MSQREFLNEKEQRRGTLLSQRTIPWLIFQLVTILFGANDICSAQCYNPQQFSPMRYALHLRKTLDFLRVALPRTLVNLVPVIGDNSSSDSRAPTRRTSVRQFIFRQMSRSRLGWRKVPCAIYCILFTAPACTMVVDRELPRRKCRNSISKLPRHWSTQEGLLFNVLFNYDKNSLSNISFATLSIQCRWNPFLLDTTIRPNSLSFCSRLSSCSMHLRQILFAHHRSTLLWLHTTVSTLVRKDTRSVRNVNLCIAKC